jgi:hypothetical protein
MSKRFLLGLVAVIGFVGAASLPALAESRPCQLSMAPAGATGCLLIADHPAPQADDRAALELYRSGLARARKGESHQAFGDFNQALELDPALTVAY